MIGVIKNYYHWLHGKWPAGKPEKLPAVNEDGSTSVHGLWVVGDLTGIPLLKFSLDTGTKAVRSIHASPDPVPEGGVDVAIVGGGCSGVAAAIEAKKLGMSYQLIESNQLFSTIANFPKKKPIFTYPMEMKPEGDLQVSAEVKEELLAELKEQTEAHGIETTPGKVDYIKRDKGGMTVLMGDGNELRAKAVVVAIGRSGNYRRMGIPGEDLDKVANRLHDPAKYTGKHVMIVGGGDSALEAAIAIAETNTQAQQQSDKPLVSLSYRKPEFARPKPDNITKITALAEQGAIQLLLGSQPKSIDEQSITIGQKGQEDQTFTNDYVFSLIGREPPLDFFRKSGVPIRGEFSTKMIIGLAALFLFITMLYGMKNWIPGFASLNGTGVNPANWMGALGIDDETTLLGTLVKSAGAGIGFWVTLLYSTAVVCFGIDRIRRRKTPYVTLQTCCLMLIQVFPLFLIPELLFPWLHHNAMMPQVLIDNLFPPYAAGDDPTFWRAYGFILAWPLMVWNVFNSDPIMWWLVIAFIQTCVIIPLLVWRYGKGAYCGWICSCGALAETMGDRHREKMPHGPGWNKVNMVGQVLLWLSIFMLGMYILSWLTGWGQGIIKPLDTTWKYLVDFLLAGALGTGLYFAYSGRVWCRFACPLAALMHIYARFSKFRITVNAKKCISCNACTTVCHQGIDIMNFANKGKHMEDPECVRCSACVQTCPTGVLAFGTVDGKEQVTGLDRLVASPVLAREGFDDRIGNTGSGEPAEK